MATNCQDFTPLGQTRTSLKTREATRPSKEGAATPPRLRCGKRHLNALGCGFGAHRLGVEQDVVKAYRPAWRAPDQRVYRPVRRRRATGCHASLITGAGIGSDGGVAHRQIKQHGGGRGSVKWLTLMPTRSVMNPARCFVRFMEVRGRCLKIYNKMTSSPRLICATSYILCSIKVRGGDRRQIAHPAAPGPPGDHEFSAAKSCSGNPWCGSGDFPGGQKTHPWSSLPGYGLPRP